MTDAVREETTNANLEIIRDIRAKVVEGKLPIPAEHRNTAIKLLNTVINALTQSIGQVVHRVIQKLREPDTIRRVKEPVRESVIKQLRRDKLKTQGESSDASTKELEKIKSRQETLL